MIKAVSEGKREVQKGCLQKMVPQTLLKVIHKQQQNCLSPKKQIYQLMKTFHSKKAFHELKLLQ